jgi:uncharacterized protein YgbK (DUF1537 family)
MTHPGPFPVRVLADDLTGALDTGAEFVTAFGPLRVVWHGPAAAASASAGVMDIATREDDAAAAAGRAMAAAPWLAGGAIAFHKIDSLLRGPWAASIGALMRSGDWRTIVLAPAHPAQGRRTVGGRQERRRGDDGWEVVGLPLLDCLRAEGMPVTALGADGRALPEGLVVADAASEADLEHIAQRGKEQGRSVLWCGAGGLARALAPCKTAADRRLVPPVLGLVGSDQSVSRDQLEACGPAWTRLDPDGDDGSVCKALDREALALCSVDLPEPMPRGAAREAIAVRFEHLTRVVPRPSTLLVAGGETLRGLCLSLGAEALEVTGQVEPGVPRSRMVGGRWDGVSVISKSGAFGTREFLRDLMSENGLLR